MGSLGREPQGRGALRYVVLLFFFCSGAAGLVLEVTWTRILGTVFGNTVFAAATVLTAFMLGLALGSAVLGRVADRRARPLMLYGALEIGVALYAFLFPVLTFLTDEMYRWFYRAADPGFILLSAVRLIFSMLLLLPPTFLMGGTLPVLGRHLGVRAGEPGREVGYLYALNTFGAVTGCFLAGFVLLNALGVRASLFAAGGVALTIGLLALAVGRRAIVTPPAAVIAPPVAAPAPMPSRKKKKRRPHRVAPEPAPESEQRPPLDAATFRLVLIAFAVTGFCAMAFEVLWTRILLFVTSTTVHAFATMLTVFLAGLAIGSFLSARFLAPRLRRPILWFGAIEILVGLSALASIAALGRLWAIDLQLMDYVARVRAGFVLLRFLDAGVVLFVPTLLMGAALPIVAVACIRGEAPVGRRTGLLYALNTVGCVLGSFAGGFILLPALGAHRSMLVLAALSFAVGGALVWQALLRRPRLVRFAVAAPLAAVALAGFLLVPPDVFYETINTNHHPSKILFLREHATGTVTVHDLPDGDRLVAVDGVDVAGLNFMLRSTQKLQGYIPILLHPNPRRVVQIGFGSGETARVGIESGLSSWTLVEICPAVFQAGRFFDSINHGSYRDPRVRKIIMDGKNFARLSDETFDVVMNDSIYPGSSGSSALYTYDHFRNCRERLAPGGLFTCWVPLDLRPIELRMILRSFQEVFPHTSLWVASNCLNKHALILGSVEPPRFDFTHIRQVMSRPQIAADLAAIEIHNAYDLLDCFVCDPASIRKFVADAPLNTDDRPALEFSCAKPKDWEMALASIFGGIVTHHAPVAPYVVRFADEARDHAELERRFQATEAIFSAQIAELHRLPRERKQALEWALRANPDEAHVRSCRAEIRQEIDALRAAVRRTPDQTRLQLRLADRLYVEAFPPNAALDAALYAEAADLYQRVVDSPVSWPPAFVRLAEIRLRSRQAAEAERLLRACLARWPTYAPAHDLLAGLYLQTGRPDLARRHIEEAVRCAPGDARYIEHRARILQSARAAN